MIEEPNYVKILNIYKIILKDKDLMCELVVSQIESRIKSFKSNKHYSTRFGLTRHQTCTIKPSNHSIGKIQTTPFERCKQMYKYVNKLFTFK